MTPDRLRHVYWIGGGSGGGKRDRLFTGRLAVEARCLGLPAIEVGAAATEDDLTDHVRRTLGLPAG